jgi:quercetin dioxygenase-like cupin family protein
MRIRFGKVFWGLIAGLLAACLIAVATAGSGYPFNNVVRSTSVTNSILQRAHSEGWYGLLLVRGPTDIVQQDVAVAPGGFSGWHSHPGPVIITIKSGTATWYSALNPTCTPTIYPAGSAFVEPANVNHYVGNQGSTDLELLNTYIIPKGVATRQEQPQPPQCPF